jgi:hypothetical protein
MGTDAGRLRPEAAKKVIRQALEEGVISYSSHAKKELAKDKMDMVDCVNVMRAGVVHEPEWENGGWRYQVKTQHMTVVVEIDLETCEVVVITAWRQK